MSIIALAQLLIFILIFVVLLVVGRIILGLLSSQHVTKLNVFLFAVGVLVGAFILDLLAFVSVGGLKISLDRQAQDRLGVLSLLAGAFLGGTAVIWLRLRKKE